MEAECAWGECVDVILALNGTSIQLYEEPTNKEQWVHGEVRQGSICMTRATARKLAEQLCSAADQADELEALAKAADQSPDDCSTT